MSAKAKRKEDWIEIVTPEDENRMASPQYIRKLLGIKDVDLSNVWNRLLRLENKITKLESPARQEKITELLRKNGKHNLTWISNRVSDYEWYDIMELLKKGIVNKTRSGSQILYSLEGDNL